jgi:hypothetical protein
MSGGRSPRWHPAVVARRRSRPVGAADRLLRADVLAEQELDRRLELPERERRLWLMDAEINNRGLSIDIVRDAALADAVEELARRAQPTDRRDVAAVATRGPQSLAGARALRFASLAGAQDPTVMADPAAFRAIQLAGRRTAGLKPCWHPRCG